MPTILPHGAYAQTVAVTHTHVGGAAPPVAALALLTATALTAGAASCTTTDAGAPREPGPPASSVVTAEPRPELTPVDGSLESEASDPLEVGLGVPARVPSELARVVRGRGATEWDSGDLGASSSGATFAVRVACVADGGPVSTVVVVTRGPVVPGEENTDRQRLLQRSVSCDGKPVRLAVGRLPVGDVGIELVEPPDTAVRGYALLVRS